MTLLSFIAGMFSIGLMVLAVGAVSGQDYPNKPIRIVTTGVGGLPDTVGRLIAQEISGPLGQPLIVDNRQNTVVQAQIVSRALPDGYTLLVTSGAFVSAPLLQNASFDLLRDFAPITQAVSAASVLVVNSSIPVKSVKELIVLAKAKPGELNYSSGGTGGSSHLAVELLKAMAGINMVRIPYASGSSEMTDLIADRVQVTFSNFATVGPHIKSGKLRGLAVSSAEPSALIPDLPTVAATLPGYEFSNAIGMAAPTKTPAAIINRLNQEIVRVINRADIRQRLLDSGLDVIASTPEQYAAKIKSQTAQWGKVIKDAGIKGD